MTNAEVIRNRYIFGFLCLGAGLFGTYLTFFSTPYFALPSVLFIISSVTCFQLAASAKRWP